MKILVAEDDGGLRLSVQKALTKTGKFEVVEATNGAEAVLRVAQEKCQIALLDVDMPEISGLEALKKIKDINPGIVVIMFTAFANIDHAVEAVRNGAYTYLQKPVGAEQLVATIEKAVRAQALINELAQSAPVLMEEGRKFIGQTQQMQRVFSMVTRLSKVDTPVLIRGASGTGKELVARALHFNSARKDGKFVAINCSAIPENLFESELFGHEKGSFTGADQRKIGKFQYAEGGTLFLDEVGDLPIQMQVKLLRVLQEKVFTPVGSNREISTDVRVIAATNRPLEEMMQKSTFREDLFYRLNVIPIFLPPLGERKDDIDTLAANFLKKFNAIHEKKVTSISRETLAILKKYDWPGNIRELENVIEHSFIMEYSKTITIGSLPEFIRKATGTTFIDDFSHGTNAQPMPSTDEVFLKNQTGSDAASETSAEGAVDWGSDDEDDLAETAVVSIPAGLGQASTGPLDFNVQKEAFEKEFIIKALKQFKGRINQTALHANIPKKTLLRKIEKYGINAREFAVTPGAVPGANS